MADIDVLVEGETGTGKELVALLLHRIGPRARASRSSRSIAARCPRRSPKANCSAMPPTACRRRGSRAIGQIEASSGGTLLLDEIDSMAPAVQAKMLRVLEEREVLPIGATRPQRVDLRVVATTKRDLGRAVARRAASATISSTGSTSCGCAFRRCASGADDIAQLFATFRRGSQGADRRRPVRADRRRCAATCVDHDWPGNVRELRNFAFQAVLGMTGEADAVARGASARPCRNASAQFEAGAIEDALRATRGSVAAALPILGIPRKTFYDKVARLGINPADFRRKG